MNGRLLAVVSPVAMAITALAQPPAPQAALATDPKPAAAQPPALAGPKVAPKAEPQGIVSVDFNGEVRRPEMTPEEAAIARLDLDDAIKARVRAIINKRDAIIDDFVSGNLDLLTKFGAAAGGNDKLDQAMLGLEAFQKLAPLREGGSLWEQVKAALPEEPAKKFDALMNEYWDAIVAEGKRTKNDKGKERTRFEIVIAERLAILGKEIERSFARQQYSGGIVIGYFTQDLNLTDAQKARVRQMSLEFARKTDFNATEDQQQKLLLELMSILNEEQRAKVIKRLGL